MPEHDPQLPVIDYFHPPVKRRWITGWDWTLLVLVFVLVFIWPMTLRSHGYNSGPLVVCQMYFIIGVRAGWGVLRRDRSLWWIPYLLLIFALPFIAGAVVKFYYTPLGSQIATDMWHFWRDLF